MTSQTTARKFFLNHPSAEELVDALEDGEFEFAMKFKAEKGTLQKKPVFADQKKRHREEAPDK